MECIFCKIVNGSLPAHKIYEDDYVLAFLDISPVNEGHVLIIPKKHVENLEEVDDLMLSHVMQIAKKVAIAMKKALGIKGYNVIMNNGSVAGQIVDHFHCHVIPRKADDGLHNWPQKSYEGDEAKSVAAKLAAELK